MITLNQIAELAASTENEIKVELINGLEITVQTSLPLEKKVEIIEELVVACSYGTEPYFNPLKLKTLTALKVLDASTDINVFEDEKIDIYALYDMLNKAEVLNKVLPHTDYQEILNWAYDSSESLISYNNSIMGIVAELKDHFSSEELKKQFGSIVEELKENPDLTNLLKIYEAENLSN